MQFFVTSLALNRLHYCNSVLFGVSATTIRRLQSVQNASDRVVLNPRRSDHISDALTCLHGLNVPECVLFKVAVVVFRSLHVLASPCLRPFKSATSSSGRSGLRSVSTNQLLVPRVQLSTTGVKHFRRLAPLSATICHETLLLRLASALSVPVLEHTC
jgi:hypothetical protein